MARPFVRMPVGAAAVLRGLAESGTLSEARAAKALGIRFGNFKELLRKDSLAKELWEEALGIERANLIELMHERARAGDTKAAQFLLERRHGMTATAPTADAAAAVKLQIVLPAPLSPAQYAQVVQVQPAQSEPLPAPEAVAEAADE